MAVKRVVCRIELILSYIIRSIIRWHRLLNDIQTKNYLQVFFSLFFFSFFPRYLIVRAQLVESGGQPSVTFLIEERPKKSYARMKEKKNEYILCY